MEPFREAVWRSVPPGAEPERFAARSRFMLGHVEPGWRVLDLGCGDGRFSALLRDHGARPTGIDVAHAAVRRARAAQPWLDARQADEGEPLPADEDSFDAVWAGEVLEHVVDTVGMVAEVRRVLRFGGPLLVTTPYHGRVATAVLALRGCAFAEHFDPRADHLRFFTEASLRGLLNDGGFPSVSATATGGPPLLRRALHVCAS
ncbi:MAG TPA: class I SAM-dependent methyltransferase [Longimicrobium sp.]|nr:class I SAM-dependent methyltransferase [Longimicrobium sp.]